MAGARSTRSKRDSRLKGVDRAGRGVSRHLKTKGAPLSLDAFPGALIVCDRKGHITDLNSAASKLIGKPARSIEGSALDEILSPVNVKGSPKLQGSTLPASMAGATKPLRAFLKQAKGRRLPVTIRSLVSKPSGRNSATTTLLIERSKPAAARPKPTSALFALLRREGPFQALYDGSNVGVALADSRGAILRANKALCGLTGYERAQLQRMTLDELTYPDDGPTVSPAEESKGRQNHPRDTRFIRRDGLTVWLRVSLTPLDWGPRAPPYVLVGLQDITALKTATENLRESEERFRSAFDASAIGMGLVSTDGRYLRVNQALCDFLGLEAEALIGRDIAEFNEPADYANIVARRQQMLDGLLPRYFSYEKRFVHKSGRPLWGQLTVALVRDVEGAPSYFVILVQDTTERHNAEITLRESEQRLRALVEGLPVLMDAFDEDGQIVAWNEECERVTGYSADEIIGNPKALEQLYPDPDYRAAMLDDAERHSLQAYRNRAWDLRTKAGKMRTVAWSNVGAAVQIPGWKEWGIGIDITERRRLELALQQASEYEQRRLGQEMHDGLGQELAALALLAYSLASKPDLADDPIRQELDRLAQIAQQAVRSGRAIAHGLAPLDESEGDLIEALRRMTQHHLAEVSGTHVVLEEHLTAELAIPATARSHLYRIAQEALNNAIRHAKAQSVRMELTVTPRLVRLTIGDDGKGFTPRAERSVGMGLKTMQNRATAIGASLSIRTESEEGTSITVECLNLSSTAENLTEPSAQRRDEENSSGVVR